jgi:hypothetical protein
MECSLNIAYTIRVTPYLCKFQILTVNLQTIDRLVTQTVAARDVEVGRSASAYHAIMPFRTA